MTDEEYLYRQDVKEKAIIARSSRNSRSARRRGCRTSTDNMTRKEWEKMNGPVHTVNLGQAMTWEEFRAMPKNLQQQYAQHILDHYAVGPYAIARMFGVSGAYCGTYLHELGIKFSGKRAAQAETERFLKDYGKPAADKKNSLEVERISLTFSGAFSPEAIAARLAGLFPEGQNATITIEVAVR